MTTTETDAGTTIIDFTPEEFAAYLDAEVRAATSYSGLDEFRRALDAGEVDYDDPGVERVLPLLQAVS